MKLTWALPKIKTFELKCREKKINRKSRSELPNVIRVNLSIKKIQKKERQLIESFN